jgi:hypothetical protein
MRKSFIGAAVVASSLVLAACGSGTASLRQVVNSLGGSQYLQMKLTASVSGTGTAKAQSVLDGLSVDINAASTNGNSLSNSGQNVNTEIVVAFKGANFVDVRQVSGNEYVKIDFSALSGIPGINISSAQAADAQLIFGGRWFELPKSLIAKYTQPTAAQKAKAQQIAGIESQVIDALSSVITAGKYTTSGNTYTTTGTIKSIADAVAPVIAQYTHSLPDTSTATGTYSMSLTADGSDVTAFSVSITAPASGTSGPNMTATLNSSISHDNQSIDAPSGATEITPQLLSQFGGGSFSSSSSATAS